MLNHSAQRPDSERQSDADRRARAVLTRCLERARQENIVAVARIEIPGGDVHVRNLCFDDTGQTDDFLWRSPGDGIAFRARGTAMSLRCTSLEEFAAQAKRVQRIANSLTADDSATGIPLFVSALKFDPRRSASSGEWADLPGAFLRIPAYLDVVAARGQAVRRFAHIIVNPSDSSSRLYDLYVGHKASLREDLRAAQASQQDATPGTPAATQLDPGDPAAEWVKRCEDLRAAIAAGSLSKVVVARSRALRPKAAHRFSAGETVRALQSGCPDAIVFHAILPGVDGAHRHFVGASPETLVATRDGSVITHALAGTIRRHRSDGDESVAADALRASAKDRHEHQLVVDAIAEDLRPHCVNVTPADEPRVLSTPSLFHLSTRIEGQTRAGVHIISLVSALHPTPALGGAPRDAAMQWLSDHEDLDRGYYGAPIGFFDENGDGRFCVAIRSALIRDDAAVLYGGAGFVAGSDTAAEWRESGSKMQTVLSALREVPCEG